MRTYHILIIQVFFKATRNQPHTFSLSSDWFHVTLNFVQTGVAIISGFFFQTFNQQEF